MKKTNKENPITTFRKNFETRSKTVMSSLKKANNGIAVNNQMTDDIINKAGSTGSYKAPINNKKPWDAPDDIRSAAQAAFASPQNNPVNLLQEANKKVRGWSEDEYKKGGATKATKFAALAPPYNKATAADRIVGAKKNARKKK